ncbi:MAG: cell division protein ZapA [Alphaproteobacteria bacterium]|nr:cell division protein ZapA [Alphaproteobacteria bacterium]
MAIVSLKIGGRFYKFSCNDGQEIHMRELADIVDKKAEQLTKSIGFMQEGQMLAMICLLLAEEKNKMERQGGVEGLETIQTQLAEHIAAMAGKVSALADSLQ